MAASGHAAEANVSGGRLEDDVKVWSGDRRRRHSVANDMSGV